MSDSAKPDLTDGDLYPLWTADVLRYADTDRQGHVNNAVFSTFFETGRVRLLLDPAQPLAPDGCAFVIARITIDFRGEILWPGEVRIGTAITSTGRSSFVLAQGLFVDERCVATAESTIVLTDQSTRRSTALPDWVQERLKAAGPLSARGAEPSAAAVRPC